jgi:hypothetical protein
MVLFHFVQSGSGQRGTDWNPCPRFGAGLRRRGKRPRLRAGPVLALSFRLKVNGRNTIFSEVFTNQCPYWNGGTSPWGRGVALTSVSPARRRAWRHPLAHLRYTTAGGQDTIGRFGCYTGTRKSDRGSRRVDCVQRECTVVQLRINGSTRLPDY